MLLVEGGEAVATARDGVLDRREAGGTRPERRRERARASARGGPGVVVLLVLAAQLLAGPGDAVAETLRAPAFASVSAL